MNVDILINKDKYSVDETLNKIIRFVEKYDRNEFLKLNTYTSIYLNQEALGSSGYKVSPRLFHNLFFFILNKVSFGNKKISNIAKCSQLFVELIEELTFCHFNFVDTSDQKSFHKSYYSYHLDFPSTSTRQYFNFFMNNLDSISEIYNTTLDDSKHLVYGLLLITNFERGWHKRNYISRILSFFNLGIEKDQVKFNAVNVFYQIPDMHIKKLFDKYGLKYKILIESLFIDIDELKKENDIIYFTEYRKKCAKYVGVKFGNNISFVRNHNVINGVYEAVLQSKTFEISKGNYLEKRTYNLLCQVFGAHNVFKNIYDVNGNEQDFIVTYKSVLLSVECKGNKFAEPFVDKLRAEKRMNHNFKKVIEKGYSQTARVVENLNLKKCKYYDSDDVHNRKEVIDISKYNSEDFFSIIVTLEEYHSLGTELQNSLDISNSMKIPLVVEINDLEIMIGKCLNNFNLDFFISYLAARKNYYGLIYTANSDELDYFGHYINNRFSFNCENKNSNIIVNLGAGYASFVTDLLDIDNYIIYTEIFGI